jgi:hypothetical protein
MPRATKHASKFTRLWRCWIASEFITHVHKNIITYVSTRVNIILKHGPAL